MVASQGEEPHAELAWDFAKQHLSELLTKGDTLTRNTYLPSVARSFSDAERADELEAVVREKIGADGLVKAKEASAVIRLSAEIRRRELPAIDKWVEAHAKFAR
jgi:hypothetical protein